MNNLVKKTNCYIKTKKPQVGKHTFFEGHENFDNQFYYIFDIWQIWSGNLEMHFTMDKMTKYAQMYTEQHKYTRNLCFISDSLAPRCSLGGGRIDGHTGGGKHSSAVFLITVTTARVQHTGLARPRKVMWEQDKLL